MKKTVNVGFIGLGGFVRGNHLPNVIVNPNYKVYGLCEIRRDILDSVARQTRPELVTTDYRELCSNKNIDLVVIGTGPEFRVEPIKAAIENNKAVYVEKPISLGYEDSAALRDILKGSNACITTGFNRPYSKIMRQAKRLYHKAQNGKTLIMYRIVCEDKLWPKFHQDKINGDESTIIHEITHIFDLLNWITEKVPHRVFAIGGKSDNNIITLEYPDQINAVIISGGCGTEGYPKELMEIFTNNKAIVVDEFIELRTAQIETEERCSLFPRKGKNFRSLVSISEHQQDLFEWRKSLTDEQIAVGYYYDSRPVVDKGHNNALNVIYDDIITKRCTVEHAFRGIHATIIALKALESLEKGVPMDLDLKDFQAE